MSAGHRLPSWVGPHLFGLLLSGFMSLLVSSVATMRAVGFTSDVVTLCLKAWLSSWPVAFLALLVVAPTVRKIVAVLVEAPGAPHATTPSS
jgi:hypothetical protein